MLPTADLAAETGGCHGAARVCTARVCTARVCTARAAAKRLLVASQTFFYRSLLLRQGNLLLKGVADTAGVDTNKTAYQQLNNLLMQLRKVCCHPFLINGAEDDPDSTPHEVSP